MDQATALNALSNLVAQYPDIPTSTVADVLEACNQDPVRAYDTLCDMTIPTNVHDVDDIPLHPSTNHAITVTSPAPRKQSPPRVPRAVTYAPPAYSFANTVEFVAPPALQGAWASANMGRRYRVEQLCKQYEWLDPSVANALFEKYHDCVELVESDILEMFPIDEPASFARISTASTQQPTRLTGEKRNLAIAEALRREAEAEMRRVAQAPTDTSMASPAMMQLRHQVWDLRTAAMRSNALANQTRKPSLIIDARKKNDELRRLSAYFLERIRQSREYRSGFIDLHGLTREEAIKVVGWKLAESGNQRFRLITGKGNNSLNGQAVLRPTLERYLTSRGVTFTSSYQDGIILVIP